MFLELLCLKAFFGHHICIDGWEAANVTRGSLSRSLVCVRHSSNKPKQETLMTAAQQSFLSTRRGILTLALLCSVAFNDFMDASIVNIALPSIRTDLHVSVQDLQWVPSGYLL